MPQEYHIIIVILRWAENKKDRQTIETCYLKCESFCLASSKPTSAKHETSDRSDEQSSRLQNDVKDARDTLDLFCLFISRNFPRRPCSTHYYYSNIKHFIFISLQYQARHVVKLTSLLQSSVPIGVSTGSSTAKPCSVKNSGTVNVLWKAWKTASRLKKNARVLVW